jgi:hypothetical protein
MTPQTPIVPGMNLPVTIYAKDQPQYLQLPVFKQDDGIVLSRWKLSFLERIKILFIGNIYVVNLTFNDPLQPIKMTVDPPINKGYNQ